MWLLKGPVAGLAKPCQAILAMASRSMANITAWRNLTLFIGALRLFSHSHEWGEKNSQPLVVSVTPGSLDRRTTSTLPDSKAAAREAASGITWKYRLSSSGWPGVW